MISRPLVFLLLLVLGRGAASGGPEQPAAPAPAIPPGAERAYRAVDPAFDERAAMEVVAFMQQFWRVAGNPGYNASIDEIGRRLEGAGFTRAGAGLGGGAFQRTDEYRDGGRGWDHSRATVAIEGAGAPVFSREKDRVALAINSFSTAGEVALPLIDVGGGTAQDYAGKDLEGAVVLGDAGLGSLWREAVGKRGAAGVISTEIAPYIRPADPGAMSEEQKDVLQWGSVPYEPKSKAFGFKASWRAANHLRAALAANPAARVRVDIQSAFYDGPVRTLAAEIRGRTRPDERIVIVAHVQEPGANDNASGCATLYALAAALNRAIAEGRLARPQRTITFLWLDEIRGSRQWMTAHPAEAKGVRYMFSMDMTGEDTAKTGGTFLIEKQADPTAVWPRPSDPHSEWGAGRVKVEALSGSLLNDLHLAVARRRARDTGWVVRTNPYEGGSDHTVFANAGVPSLLNWHFTDRYYHTNQDTTDKVSMAEMKNVGVTVATSAYLLASATEADALAIVDLLQRAALDRLALERRQGAGIVAQAADKATAEKIESEVIEAWIKWYGEAFDSVATLPAGAPSAPLDAAITAARRLLRGGG
jgi:aminopeptidase YwaD